MIARRPRRGFGRECATVSRSPFDQSGEIRTIRLVGAPDAVAWVAAELLNAGRMAETFEAGDPHAPKSFGRGPVVWIARLESADGPRRGWPPVSDAGVWAFPCLIVMTKGEMVPEEIPGQTSVESFDIVR